MANFAEEKEAWLRGGFWVAQRHSLADTLSDVLGRIDRLPSRRPSPPWATAVLPGLADELICVDGKAVRGSRDRANPAVHWVSAFAGRALAGCWRTLSGGREVQRDHRDPGPAGAAGLTEGGDGVDRRLGCQKPWPSDRGRGR